MRRALRANAREHQLKAREGVDRALVMLRMYRKDPVQNEFLRFEAESLLRYIRHHLRQHALLKAAMTQLR